MAKEPAGSVWVYVGTYTHTLPHVQARGLGIEICRLDMQSGILTPAGRDSGVVNPSYLAYDERRHCLYAVEEMLEGRVGAYGADPLSGKMVMLSRQSSGGKLPAFLSLDRTGRRLLVANYESGSTAVLPVGEDGSLSPAIQVVQHDGHSADPVRQRGPHVHWAGYDPAGRFVQMVDLGLDTVLTYSMDESTGRLVRASHPSLQLAPGAGPRHLAFHPDGLHAYLVTEIDAAIVACEYDAEKGALTARQRLSTLPANSIVGGAAAAVRVHPSGRFVYVSNRGVDTIAIFTVGDGGLLAPAGQQPALGRTPRDFVLDPDGRFLLVANQDSDSVVTFAVDAETGRLQPIDRALSVLTPACVTMGARIVEPSCPAAGFRE